MANRHCCQHFDCHCLDLSLLLAQRLGPLQVPEILDVLAANLLLQLLVGKSPQAALQPAPAAPS